MAWCGFVASTCATALRVDLASICMPAASANCCAGLATAVFRRGHCTHKPTLMRRRFLKKIRRTGTSSARRPRRRQGDRDLVPDAMKADSASTECQTGRHPQPDREFVIMPPEHTVHVAIELSFSSWLVAVRLPGVEKSRLHHIEGG